MGSRHQAFEKVEMLSSKISPFFSVFVERPARYGRSQHCGAIPHQQADQGGCLLFEARAKRVSGPLPKTDLRCL